MNYMLSRDSRLILSLLAISTLSWLLFIRIIRPARFAQLANRFRLIITAVSLVTVIAAVAGPYVTTLTTKQDRLIERTLPDLPYAIERYLSDKKQLPSKLSDVTLESYQQDTQLLIDKNLVSYEVVAQPEPADAAIYEQTADSFANSGEPGQYRLCVNYKKAKGTGKNPVSGSSNMSPLMLDTSNHASGRVCYDLETTTYPEAR